jgi:hypothetical protein
MRWRWNVIGLAVAVFAVGFVLGVTAGTNVVMEAATNYYPDLIP